MLILLHSKNRKRLPTLCARNAKNGAANLWFMTMNVDVSKLQLRKISGAPTVRSDTIKCNYCMENTLYHFEVYE